MKRRKLNETSEDAEKRRISNKEANKRQRLKETQEDTDRRRMSVREAMQRRRLLETSEIAEQRRASNRVAMQRQRKQATQEAIEASRECARTRMEKKRKESQSKEKTIDDCAASFRAKIAEGPIYVCTSCHRLLYRSAVLEMKVVKYAVKEGTKNILQSVDKVQTNGKSWVCRTCDRALKKGDLPVQSWDNGLGLARIPPELQDLRPLELRLISQRLPFMKMIGLPRGGQKAIHGSAVNVPLKLDAVVSLLPRLPETAQIVEFKLKRKLCYSGHYMHEYIRPPRVIQALKWLQQNNPLYKDISLYTDWEQEWKNNNSDLWDAMTSNECEEIEEHIAQDDSTTEDTNNSLSSCYMPDGSLHRYYIELQQAAKSRNMKIKDVPGDGDCFFHAVSHGLQRSELPSICGPDLRNQLITHLEGLNTHLFLIYS